MRSLFLEPKCCRNPTCHGNNLAGKCFLHNPLLRRLHSLYNLLLEGPGVVYFQLKKIIKDDKKDDKKMIKR